MPNGFSVLGGQTRCPCGPFDPSGSSSGSGVAVAANLAAAAVGSETQGSIIMPGRGQLCSRAQGEPGAHQPRPHHPTDRLDGRARAVGTHGDGRGSAAGGDDGRGRQGPCHASGGSTSGGRQDLADYTQYLDAGRSAGMRVGIVAMDEAAVAALAAAWADGEGDAARIEQNCAAKSGCGMSACTSRRKVLAALGVEVVEVPAAAVPPRAADHQGDRLRLSRCSKPLLAGPGGRGAGQVVGGDRGRQCTRSAQPGAVRARASRVGAELHHDGGGVRSGSGGTPGDRQAAGGTVCRVPAGCTAEQVTGICGGGLSGDQRAGRL